MIFAIDESGDYSKNVDKENIFLSAFIPSTNGKLQTKQEQFTKWKLSISIKEGIEIKGQLLSDAQIYKFLTDVVLAEPIIYTSFTSINPARTNLTAIQKHLDLDILKELALLDFFKETNYNKKIINSQNDKIKWLGKRNLNEYMKMISLKFLLLKSFRENWEICININNIEELFDVSCKIDSDFIHNYNTHWKKYFFDSLSFYSKEYPVKIPLDWKDGHELLKHYNFNNESLDVDCVFNKNIFGDSKENFEIQIADILGIIPYRFRNGKRKEEIEVLFAQTLYFKGRSYEEILLKDVNILEELIVFKEKLNKIKVEKFVDRFGSNNITV